MHAWYNVVDYYKDVFLDKGVKPIFKNGHRIYILEADETNDIFIVCFNCGLTHACHSSYLRGSSAEHRRLLRHYFFADYLNTSCADDITEMVKNELAYYLGKIESEKMRQNLEYNVGRKVTEYAKSKGRFNRYV